MPHQFGESSKANVSRLELSPLALSAESASVTKADSSAAIDTAIPVGQNIPSLSPMMVAGSGPLDPPFSLGPQMFPATFASYQGTMDGVGIDPLATRALVNDPTPLDSPRLVERLKRRGPLTTADDPAFAFERPMESISVALQACGPAGPVPPEGKIYPKTRGTASLSARDQFSQSVEKSVCLVEEFGPAVVGRPITRIDASPHALPAEDLITTTAIPPSTCRAAPRRFRLPLFQRPALLGALIDRLSTKRNLIHSWRAADRTLKGGDAPPIRHRLGDLDPSQIYEYLKSGGKSINAQSQSAKEMVRSPFFTPSLRHLSSRYTGIIYTDRV